MDPLKMTMFSIALAATLAGFAIGYAVCLRGVNRKEKKFSRSNNDLKDDFLTDARVRISNYLLNKACSQYYVDDVRTLIDILKYPKDPKQLVRWYNYVGSLIDTIAKGDGTSESFKKYLDYTDGVIAEMVINEKVDATRPLNCTLHPLYPRSIPETREEQRQPHPLDPRSL